jgi:hypothetical protein
MRHEAFPDLGSAVPRLSLTLGFYLWGGVDSNHRPADYEFATRQAADLQELLDLLVRSIP